jgi:hypothetical protein
MLCKSRAGVIPAKAGIQKAVDLLRLSKTWIPAFAGMTAFCRASLVLKRQRYATSDCVTQATRKSSPPRAKQGLLS